MLWLMTTYSWWFNRLIFSTLSYCLLWYVALISWTYIKAFGWKPGDQSIYLILTVAVQFLTLLYEQMMMRSNEENNNFYSIYFHFFLCKFMNELVFFFSLTWSFVDAAKVNELKRKIIIMTWMGMRANKLVRVCTKRNGMERGEEASNQNTG